jgi:hypothetical protein
MPGYHASSDPALVEAQTKDAFSTVPHDDQEDYRGSHEFQAGEQYAPLQAYEVEDTNHPIRAADWVRGDPHDHDDYNTSYGSTFDKTRQSPRRDHVENPFEDYERNDPDTDQSYYGAGRP